MENLHVKLEAQEAIDVKRNILNAEMNLINLIKKVEDYRNLRILELKRKTTLRTELKKTSVSLIELKKQLPNVKEPEKMEKIEAGSGLGKVAMGRMELELMEIREQLEKLG